MVDFLGDYFKDYRKGLLLATGGGNDIVSALIPAHYLASQGVWVDIAGMCSPGAHHTYEGKFEQPVNKVTPDTKRFVANHKHHQINFIDAMLPDLVKQKNIGDFYNLSLQYGTPTLRNHFNEFVFANDYEFVLGVDVGGDVLARGWQDPTVLSPLMDLSALALLKTAQVDSYLLEFGLLTDGELRPRGLQEIIAELEGGMLMHESSLHDIPDSVEYFKKIYGEIGKTREGRTAKYTLESLKPQHRGKNITATYRFRNRFDAETAYTPFTVVLPHELHGKALLIEPVRLAQEREDVLMDQESLFWNYYKARLKNPSWHTELDGFAIYDNPQDGFTGPSKLIMTFSDRVNPHVRDHFIKQGIAAVDKGLYDQVFLRHGEIPRWFDLSYDARKYDFYPNKL